MLKDEAWSWEKNKKFELALLDVNEEVGDRWDKIATMVGGKNAKEVEDHYKALVQDVNLIESGLFDDDDELNELAEPQIIQKSAITPPLGLCFLSVEIDSHQGCDCDS
uniref:Myb-like domain-containing protein n=1 Tax=Kalanchoe fedtschenkoi TaxID=63787 RepID=A0A7N1A2Z5_KALFE